MTDCIRARVDVQEIKVIQAEQFGPGFEPGTSAEWQLHFNVAGQTFDAYFDSVKNGSILQIQRSFVVDLSLGQNLVIEVWGEEQDPFSHHDYIPKASHRRRFGKARKLTACMPRT